MLKLSIYYIMIMMIILLLLVLMTISHPAGSISTRIRTLLVLVLVTCCDAEDAYLSSPCCDSTRRNKSKIDIKQQGRQEDWPRMQDDKEYQGSLGVWLE